MLFVAEIGLNHNGNFDLACEMIRQAKYAGADIAKFQCGWRLLISQETIVIAILIAICSGK